MCIKISVCLGAILLLSSCATLDYVEPTSEPRARVRFTTDLGGNTYLRTYETPDCLVNEKKLLHFNINPDPFFGRPPTPRRLGIPLWTYQDNQAKEIYLVANKLTHGFFSGSGQFQLTIYQCGVPFSYAFQENEDYEVKFVWDPEKCKVHIFKFEENVNEVVTKELVASFANRGPKSSGCFSKLGG